MDRKGATPDVLLFQISHALDEVDSTALPHRRLDRHASSMRVAEDLPNFLCAAVSLLPFFFLPSTAHPPSHQEPLLNMHSLPLFSAGSPTNRHRPWHPTHAYTRIFHHLPASSHLPQLILNHIQITPITNQQSIIPLLRQQGSYVGIHSTGFRDFLLKPELLRAISDLGFEHPSEGEKDAK